MNENPLWRGLKAEAQAQLRSRDYTSPSIEERLATCGMDAGSVVSSERALKDAGAWIPGVELIHRTIHPQRHRGWFSELGRQGEARLGEIRLWPKQWAAAKMFAGSAKGFHVHPPAIPEKETSEGWMKKLFETEEPDHALRPYDSEQWDIMYFLQGRLDLILCDERAGLPRRKMRLFIDGDDRRGPNNAAIVIPAGVAHALRAEGSEDLLMVYGTSTTFNPDFEGRLVSSVEDLALPPEWDSYLSSDSK